MKIKKQYDLLRKIKHSKEGKSAMEFFLEVLKKHFVLSLNNLMFLIYFLVTGNFLSASVNLFCYSSIFLASSLTSKLCKQAIINVSEYDLQVLVNELSKLEVKTSVELLQEAKINQVDYKIKYEDDDKLPRLVQCKYIDIPLANGYEETLLQEYAFGDKDYELSVNSPVKKMNLKLAKGNI